MDSILGVEVKQILESEFNVIFTPEDIQNMTFAKLYLLKEKNQNHNQNGKTFLKPFEVFFPFVIALTMYLLLVARTCG